MKKKAGARKAQRRTADAPFVGREAELSRLEELVRQAARGKGAVAVISGDHGVGKTRLAREAAAAGTRAGLLVLWARGYDDQGAPAYWPWAELISRYIEASGAEQARRLMGPGASAIGGLIPGLEDFGPAARGVAGELPSSEARYRLFRAVAYFLRRASGERPLMVVLDDLHYCDSDSLRLLEVVAEDLGETPLLVVATCVGRVARHSPQAASALAALAKLPWHHELRIENLGGEAVRQLLEPDLGRTRASSLAGEVHRLTEGNPLFVVEVARHLRDSGAGSGWATQAAGSVVLLVSRRLARLSPEARELLQTAAVLGREFELSALARALKRDSAQAARLLAGAIDQGFIDRADGQRYRFTHELVQRGIAADLDPGETIRTHRIVAEALEALRAGGERVEPARLARAFREAGPELTDKAVRYELEAGKQALQAVAYETALRHFDEAAAVPGQPPAARGELALLRAWTLFALGRFEEVIEHLGAAFDISVAQGDLARAADTAAFAYYPLAAGWLPHARLRELQERALPVAPPDSPEAARLLCALAQSCSYTDYAAADRHLARSLEIARRLGDLRQEALTVFVRAWVEHRNLRWPAHLTIADQALQAARRCADRDVEIMCGGRVGVWRLCAGDWKGAERIMRELPAGWDSAPSTMWTFQAQLLQRYLFVWRGGWRDHRAPWDDRFWLDHTRTWFAREGQAPGIHPPEAILASIDRGFMNTDGLGQYAAMAANASRMLGDRSQIPAIKALAGRSLTPEASPLGRLCARVALGFAAVEESDLPGLKAAYDPELAAAPPDCALEYGLVLDSARGLFASCLGRNDEARECLQRALDFCRRAGFVWELPWACLYLAALLLGQGGAKEAGALFEEAERAGADLEMPGFERELDELRARLQGARPGGLTHREVEVVRLVATGMATKQIAAELSISYHTVVNHLRVIYRKTGAKGRVELARYAVARNLTAP